MPPRAEDALPSRALRVAPGLTFGLEKCVRLGRISPVAASHLISSRSAIAHAPPSPFLSPSPAPGFAPPPPPMKLSITVHPSR